MLFSDIETDLFDKVKFLKQQSDGIDNMLKLYKTLLQNINVLNYAAKVFNLPVDQKMFGRGTDNEVSSAMEQPLLSGYEMRIAYLGGTINRDEQMRFKKLIFRATRGKAYVQFADYQVPIDDRLRSVYGYESKLVYLVMFEDGGHLRDRVHKICASFGESV